MDLPASHYEHYVSERYTPPMVNDISVPFLHNFQKEAYDLYRSAWPSPLHLRKLSKQGIDVVINFQLTPDLEVPGGPEHLIHIPAIGEYPTREDVIDFLQIINYIRYRESLGEPHKILIHCTFGKDRTGLMAAAYQRVFEDKSLEEVEREYIHFGHADVSYFEELMADPQDVQRFRESAQYLPKEKYLRSFTQI